MTVWQELTQEQQVKLCWGLIKKILHVFDEGTPKEAMVNCFIDLLAVIGKQENCLEDIKQAFLKRIMQEE